MSLDSIKGLNEPSRVSRATAALEANWPLWLERPGVNWLDIGPKQIGGEWVGELAVRLFVEEKLPIPDLATDEVFPEDLQGVPTDVIQSSSDEALELSERDLADLPELAPLYTLRGNMLAAVDRVDESAAAYQRATEIDPRSRDAWTGLGRLMAALERLDEATQAYRRAADIDPNSADILSALSFVLLESGNLSEAQRAYEAARQIDPQAEELDDLKERLAVAFRLSESQSTAPPRPDRVYTVPDVPDFVDRLGRQPLAESLATRFRTMREEDSASSFLLHIDGPWGAGKSTLLNFLRDELKSDSLVVYFNAWREQRAGPPWWGLLLALRRSAFEKPDITLRTREFLARFRAVGPGYLLAIGLAAIITIGTVSWAAVRDFEVTSLRDGASAALAVIALAGTVWTATIGLSRRLLPGSAHRAQQYVQFNTDPMQGVADHFEEFVRLVKRPVVIFIDDLDRCTESYVVEFLEAVQTLVRIAPTAEEQARRPNHQSRRTWAPYFVVAADGRWIRASYETVYSSFAGGITYLGRSLGYLFLEKTFQLTTTLPEIQPDRRQAFMDYLLRIDGSENLVSENEAQVKRAQKVIEGAGTDTETIDRLKSQGHGDPGFRFALLGEAVKHMARPEIASITEHALREYAALLDPNPRAMKRFVNAYGVERALRTIEDRYPPLDQLARWSIVLLRWPELAETLRNDPESVELVGTHVRGEISEGVKHLFLNPDVFRVVKGTDPSHGKALDAAAIRECAGLPTLSDTSRSAGPPKSARAENDGGSLHENG